LIAAVAADADNQATPRRHGRKAHLAARKLAAEARHAGKGAKAEGNPAPIRHANAKSDGAAKSSDKGAADAAAAKQAKPKAAAKPAAKPAPKTSSGDSKPAG